jgi:hypothetical protein
LNENCTSQCENTSGGADVPDPLPAGVEKSLWTELNITLLGERKRIIQIETHFTAIPHLFKSYACPNMSVHAVDSCNNTRENASTIVEDDVIILDRDSPYFTSQKSNSLKNFRYTIQGDVCTGNVYVCKFCGSF